MGKYSEEAEKALISACFGDRDTILEAAAIVRESDFYVAANGILFATMVKLADKDVPVDLVTVVDQLGKDGNTQKVGGLGYVAQVANAGGSGASVAHYVRIIKDGAKRRKLEALAAHLSVVCSEEERDVDAILDEAAKLVGSLSEDGVGDGLEPVSDIVQSNLKSLEQGVGATGLPTGFADLDRILGGLHKSDLIILAARPAMGKTALALNIAQNASAKEPVAVFSLEMSKEQLVNRMLAATGEIDQQALKIREMTLDDWTRTAAAAAKIADCQLYIDDTPAITVREIRARCRKLQKQRGLGLIVIDYLQLIGSDGKTESRQQEVSQISRQLKALARELDVPVLTLSQLSRAVENTSDKRPSMSHLRESGSIEQDADIVAFIYREEYYKEYSEKQNMAEIIIAKHRNGATGTVELSFRKEYTKFGNLYRGV